MKKREFLSVAALAGLALPGASQAQTGGKAARGPVLLTIGGAIGAGNRGAVDPALDQLMVKQKVAFEKAQVFDFAALAALPSDPDTACMDGLAADFAAIYLTAAYGASPSESYWLSDDHLVCQSR